MSRSLPAIAGLLASFASVAAAAPLQSPLTNQAAVLSYEIEVTGASGGKTLRQSLAVETPVLAREADGINPLAQALTEGQEQQVAEISASMMAAGAEAGINEILEANRLLEAMAGACAGSEGAACAEARARYQASERRMAEHGAEAARTQTEVFQRDEDRYRFLTFAAGERGGGCGVVRYEHQLGERRIAGVYPDPDSPERGLVACQTLAVLDRRDGTVALQMSPATLNIGGVRIVDLQKLQGVSGLEFGALRMSVRMPPQPTRGPDQDYAGARTVPAGGLSYTFRWRLKLN